MEQAGAAAIEYVAYPTPSTRGGTLRTGLDDSYGSFPTQDLLRFLSAGLHGQYFSSGTWFAMLQGERDVVEV